MKPFINLSVEENQALLKFPAYISLFTANNDGKLINKKGDSFIF